MKIEKLSVLYLILFVIFYLFYRFVYGFHSLNYDALLFGALFFYVSSFLYIILGNRWMLLANSFASENSDENKDKNAFGSKHRFFFGCFFFFKLIFTFGGLVLIFKHFNEATYFLIAGMTLGFLLFTITAALVYRFPLSNSTQI